MTAGALYDRIAAVVLTATGYARASAPFSFDQQPDTKLHRVLTLAITQLGGEGWVGPATEMRYQVEVYLALRIQRDADGAIRQLLSDLAMLGPALIADSDGDSYWLDSPGETDQRDPAGAKGGDFIMGRYLATVYTETGS